MHPVAHHLNMPITTTLLLTIVISGYMTATKLTVVNLVIEMSSWPGQNEAEGAMKNQNTF